MAPRVLYEPPDPSLCVKCKVKEPLSGKNAAFCSDCFLETLENKFKRVYTSARSTSSDRTGVVAFSGGANSRAVLDLVLEFERREAEVKAGRDARWQGEDKAVLHAIEIVHVLEAGQQAPSLPAHLPLRILQLQDLFESSAVSLDLLDPQLVIRRDCSGSVQSLLDGLSPSSRVSMLAILRKRVIEVYAKQKGHTVIVYGDCATRLAARSLDAISSGRAWAIGELVAPSLSEPDGLLTLRPLHAIPEKDIAVYSSLRELETDSSAQPDTSNLTGLTDVFVRGLMNGFPATVSTVSKTVGKLDLRSQTSSFVPRCPLCRLPADPEASKWRATHAIHSLSVSLTNGIKHKEQAGIRLASLLCYACLGMLQDTLRLSKGVTERRLPLPGYLYQVALNEQKRRQDATQASGLTEQLEQLAVAE